MPTCVKGICAELLGTHLGISELAAFVLMASVFIMLYIKTFSAFSIEFSSPRRTGSKASITATSPTAVASFIISTAVLNCSSTESVLKKSQPIVPAPATNEVVGTALSPPPIVLTPALKAATLVAFVLPQPVNALNFS